MAASEAQPAVRFCYRCGRHVGRDADRCWYCDAPTRRVLRPPRRCPYCQEVIARDAVKCRHCGEFLDGRPRATAPAGPVVFVVDRSLLHADRDLRLEAGRPVPPEIASALDRDTIRAIEHNRPDLIARPEVRALPAPDAAQVQPGVIDVQARPAEPPPPVPRAPDAPPAPRASAPRRPSLAQRLGGWLARRARAASPQGAPAPDVLDAEAEDTYRICDHCGTEILASDNFCFHCGVQYRTPRPARSRRTRSRPIEPSNAGFYFVSLVLMGALTGTKLGIVPPVAPPYMAEILALGAAVPALLAFVNRRRFVSQLFSLALLLLDAALYWLI